MRHSSIAKCRAPTDPIMLAAGTWLAAGSVLFGLTPLPLHSVAFGFGPAFWWLAAPAIVLCMRRFTWRRMRPYGVGRGAAHRAARAGPRKHAVRKQQRNRTTRHTG